VGSVRIYSKSGIRVLGAKQEFQSESFRLQVKPTVTERKAMSSIYYSAAWTECGCLISCWHEHKTVAEAASCIPCAGGYVVSVENDAMRSLTTVEESEFQSVIRGNSANTPTPDATVQTSAEASRESGYAVMTRIRVGDRWTWSTWTCFETHAEAGAHARKSNKVARLRFHEWIALFETAESASPSVRDMQQENLFPRGEGETLVEFVLRFLACQTQNQPDGGRHGQASER
jgi:hypothetical protein